MDESKISGLYLLQPIDTWLGQTLKIVFESRVPGKLQERQKMIVKLCEEAEVSSISFNQGAWVLGSQIAGEFETLERILIKRDFDIIEKHISEKERYLNEAKNVLAHLGYQD